MGKYHVYVYEAEGGWRDELLEDEAAARSAAEKYTGETLVEVEAVPRGRWHVKVMDISASPPHQTLFMRKGDR